MRRAAALVKATLIAWLRDGAPSMGAALAFYSAFSIAPLLVITIAIGSMAFGTQSAEAAIIAQLRGLIGEQGSRAVEAMLRGAHHREAGWLATLLGTVTLFVGATSVFAELESALDRIWRAPPRVGSGVLHFVRTRLLSFGLVLGIGFLLLVSLVVTTVLAIISAHYGALLPRGHMVLETLHFVASFAVVTLLFALIYKWLPNVAIAWGHVWMGAAVTALLFNLGRGAIGAYLGNTAFTSAYGATGAFVVLLLWLYYSAQVFLLGAEFTWVYANERPRRPSLPPSANGWLRSTPAPASAFVRHARRIEALRTGHTPGLRTLTILATAGAGFLAARVLRQLPDHPRLDHSAKRFRR